MRLGHILHFVYLARPCQLSSTPELRQHDWHLQAHFHGYAVAGNPSALTHCDYYSGKGVGQAILQTPAGLLTVFNTHTCANYSHKYTGMSHPFRLHHAPMLPTFYMLVSSNHCANNFLQANSGICDNGIHTVNACR